MAEADGGQPVKKCVPLSFVSLLSLSTPLFSSPPFFRSHPFALLALYGGDMDSQSKPVDSQCHAAASSRPPTLPHPILPDVGEIGSLPTHRHWALRTFGSLASNTVSFLLFILFLAGVPTSSGASNALAWSVLVLWLAANMVRRVTPFLWTEPGKLTYGRVPAVTSTYVPATLRGRAAFLTLLADALLLPLVLAFAAFHDVFVFSLFGFAFYPPDSGSAATVILLFLLFGLASLVTGVLAYLVVLPRTRTHPSLGGAGKGSHSQLAVFVPAAVLLSVPALTWSCAVLGCSGGHLRFSRGIRCQGPGHHAFALFGMALLVSTSCVAEVAMGYVASLQEDGAAPPHGKPRNDAFFLELQTCLRYFVVIVASLSTHASAFLLVTVASTGLLLYVLLNKSMYVVSSVGVLKDLYVLSLSQVAVSSSVIAALATVGLSNWMGLLVWLVVWLLSLGFGVYSYVSGNGRAVFG